MAKTHHYLPQHYLKGFALLDSPGRVYVFDKETKRTYAANVANTATENYFYAIQDEDGQILPTATIIVRPSNNG